MLSVLLVAPTVDADDVGEAWVAFQWAHHLSAAHRVTLLTYRKRGAGRIQEQLPNTRVIEWEEPPLPKRAERLNSLLKPAYFPFAWQAHRWIKRAINRGEQFDVAHQPLPVAMRYPTPLLNLPIPYVIGPVGGSLDSPPAFQAEDTAPWYVSLRKFDSARLKLDPLLRATYRRAHCVLGIAPYVSDALKPIELRRFECLSETGLSDLPPIVHRAPGSAPVRLLFVGRVIRTKGVRDLVASLALLKDVSVVLDIVGDGFDLEHCRRLTQELGLTNIVHFHGWQDKSAISSFYENSDIFVFPSFREPGGNVVFEAMARSLALVVCDRGGPGAATDDSCAIKLSADSPSQLAADLAAAISTLASDERLRLQMGEAARRRVEQVGLWSSKIERVATIYEEVIRARNNA